MFCQNRREDAISGQAVSLPLRHLSPARAILRQYWKSRRGVRAHESSRSFLDCSYGVHRIPPDWPGPANFQQPLNYGRIPRSSSRISPCHHVHSPGGAPTKTCFHCTFHRTNPAELGHSPRKPQLRSEGKALIQTSRLEAGDFRKPLLYPTELRGPSFSTTATYIERFQLHRTVLSVNALLSPVKTCPWLPALVHNAAAPDWSKQPTTQIVVLI